MHPYPPHPIHSRTKICGDTIVGGAYVCSLPGGGASLCSTKASERRVVIVLKFYFAQYFMEKLMSWIWYAQCCCKLSRYKEGQSGQCVGVRGNEEDKFLLFLVSFDAELQLIWRVVTNWPWCLCKDSFPCLSDKHVSNVSLFHQLSKLAQFGHTLGAYGNVCWVAFGMQGPLHFSFLFFFF